TSVVTLTRTPTASSSAPTSPTAAPTTRTLTPVEVTELAADKVAPDYPFQTPSKRIACVLMGTSAGGGPPYAVRCDFTGKAQWTVPKPSGGCALDWGGDSANLRSVGLSGDPARPHVNCISDSVKDPAATVLAYGTGIRIGSITCESRSTGLRCLDPSGGSFEISLQALYMQCTQPGGTLRDVPAAAEPCA
ncbi:MAG TPA: DUF6636 domain-containing protein, partial [Candidatus Lustribacter sp.]|nr:DUF6636 domain-containing protein [Candidatus Lustribacter sp.]